MAKKQLTLSSATELAARLQTRDLSATAVVEAYLARIAESEPRTHAWTVVAAEHALAQARVLDAGPIVGPLHGVPVGVKDIIDTADLATEYGSPIYLGHRPASDAACVAGVRAAGGIVLGKTTTTEFATFRPTETRNPRNHDYTPGGSSSGSAAAVADRMVPFAFGTQTLGSIIRPASFCGVVGYKPTFGMMDRTGTKLCAESLDTLGVLAGTVADAALLVGAVAGRAGLLTLPTSTAMLRVGLCRTRDWNRVGPEVGAAMEATAAALARARIVVSIVDLPDEFGAIRGAVDDVYRFELARSLAYERQFHDEQLSTALRDSLIAAEATTAAQYGRATALLAGARAMVPALLADCDVLLAPSTTGEAPRGLTSTGSPVMNALWTALHLPCVSIPVAHGPNGLPVGLQVVGRFGDDANVLSAAARMLAAVEGD